MVRFQYQAGFFQDLLGHWLAGLLLPEPADFLLVVAPHDRLVAEDVDALRVRVFDVLEGKGRARRGGHPLAKHAWKQQEQEHPEI